MDLEFCVKEYLLAWYLLYSASLSKEIDKFRKNLWSKYKKEYNFCYKDKQEIIKYGKDFIPDNDVLYNEIFASELYISLKKETVKHKMYLSKLFHTDTKNIKKSIKEIMKLNFQDNMVYVIHPRMECMEYYENYDAIVWGSDRDKYDAIKMLFMTMFQGIYSNYNVEYKEVVDSVLELAILDEFGHKLGILSNDSLANPTLKIIKRQIYPFWLMYLGYDTKDKLLNKMLEDKIAFDLDYYPINKNIKKLNFEEFLDFCIKNNRHILKLGNVLKIEKEEDIEVI